MRPRGRSGRILLLVAAVLSILQLLPSMLRSTRQPPISRAFSIMNVTSPTDVIAEWEEQGFRSKVLGAAVQGAVAAMIAATLAACMEPLVSGLITKRMTLSQAVLTGQIGKVFRDTFSTYLLKFPVFEVINAILAFTALPGQVRGICNGFLYCTITLPSTNCRYSKSMGLEIKPSLLYQAYLPTLARDIVYGWSREFMRSMLMSTVQPGSIHGEVICFGIAIFAASVLSSPCNEWRGYTLLSQRKGTKKRHFNEYFRPVNYLRSTAISSSIMGIALMMGMLAAPSAEDFFAVVQARHPITLSRIVFVGIVATVVMKVRAKRLPTN